MEQETVGSFGEDEKRLIKGAQEEGILHPVYENGILMFSVSKEVYDSVPYSRLLGIAKKAGFTRSFGMRIVQAAKA